MRAENEREIPARALELRVMWVMMQHADIAEMRAEDTENRRFLLKFSLPDSKSVPFIRGAA